MYARHFHLKVTALIRIPPQALTHLTFASEASQGLLLQRLTSVNFNVIVIFVLFSRLRLDLIVADVSP